MSLEQNVKDANSLAKSSFYSLLLYDAARRSKRRNIISFVAEGSFRGNTKYGFIAINEIFRQRGVDCELVWLGGVNDHAAISEMGYNALPWDKTWRAADKALHSKLVVYGNFDWASERSYERQLCVAGARRIYLGHGIPAKHIGYSQIDTRANVFSFAGMAHETLGYTDVISESSELEATYESAFPSADIHHLGSVRNDVFAVKGQLDPRYLYGLSAANYMMVQRAKKLERKIILYAPTYREKAQSLSTFIDNVKLFYDSLSANDDWFVIAKYHPGFRSYASSDTAALYAPHENVMLLGDNEDVQPYLRDTDLLITDYSSIYYDYLLLDRPVIFFQPDRAEYEAARKRNFYKISDNLTIGPVVEEPEKVKLSISEQLTNRELHSVDRQKFARFLHGHGNDGRAGERLADFLIKKLADFPH